MRLRSLAVIVLGVGLAGCGSTTFSGQDVRVRTAGETLYLLVRSDDVSRSLCGSLGGDVAQAEARWAIDGRSMQLGRVSGCHTVRHVIVCSEDDGACMAHEERHRTLGAYHP